MPNSIREIFLLFVCLAVAFAVGAVAGRQTCHAPNEAVVIEIPDMEYKGDLLMTVAVGMCGTAVMTDVSFAASDPDMTREIAFHHDTGAAIGLVGAPVSRGVYRCLVSEYSNEHRREFRVREHWEVGR